MKKYAVIAFGMDENPNGWTLLPAIYSLESSAQKLAEDREMVTGEPTKVVEVSALLQYAKALTRLQED